MKTISLLVSGMFLAFGAGAQVGVGLMGGVNLNTQIDHYKGETTQNHPKVGPFGGFIFDVKLGKNWSIQPGLMYSMKGGQNEREMEYMGPDGPVGVKVKSKNTLHYIEVPLNFVYKFQGCGGNFFLGAGGYAATLVSAYADVRIRSIIDGEEENVLNDARTHIKVGEKDQDDMHRFDFGLTGIVGYQFNSGWFIRGGVDAGLYDIIRNDNVASYQASLPTSVNNTDATSKNVTYHLGVGYMLR